MTLHQVGQLIETEKLDGRCLNVEGGLLGEPEAQKLVADRVITGTCGCTSGSRARRTFLTEIT